LVEVNGDNADVDDEGDGEEDVHEFKKEPESERCCC
jgi:hypothetical protein